MGVIRDICLLDSKAEKNKNGFKGMVLEDISVKNL